MPNFYQYELVYLALFSGIVTNSEIWGHMGIFTRHDLETVANGVLRARPNCKVDIISDEYSKGFKLMLRVVLPSTTVVDLVQHRHQWAVCVSFMAHGSLPPIAERGSQSLGLYVSTEPNVVLEHFLSALKITDNFDADIQRSYAERELEQSTLSHASIDEISEELEDMTRIGVREKSRVNEYEFSEFVLGAQAWLERHFVPVVIEGVEMRDERGNWRACVKCQYQINDDVFEVFESGGTWAITLYGEGKESAVSTGYSVFYGGPAILACVVALRLYTSALVVRDAALQVDTALSSGIDSNILTPVKNLITEIFTDDSTPEYVRETASEIYQTLVAGP